jgi:hypothetical protein
MSNSWAPSPIRGATIERSSRPTALSTAEVGGLTWNMALETGGFLVSQEIQLELHVELIREE